MEKSLKVLISFVIVAIVLGLVGGAFQYYILNNGARHTSYVMLALVLAGCLFAIWAGVAYLKGIWSK